MTNLSMFLQVTAALNNGANFKHVYYVLPTITNISPSFVGLNGDNKLYQIIKH